VTVSADADVAFAPMADRSLPTLALDRLRTLTGDARAEFRPDQLEAIRDVVTDRARVLCVQRTGWGKSAVYFVATALLREAGAGPTLIVSPLLALMRNQILAAERMGLRATTINSTNRDDWDDVRARLAADDVDLLLISPERLDNPLFREEMLPLFARSVGLLVIDEAHCISDWGHDFRPDYRRVKEMLDSLGADAAVLATTATANDRVVGDVLEQLSGGDVGALRSYRGPLARTSLRLETVSLPRAAERLAWLVEHLPTMEGSGIVYTLTKRDAHMVAAFLDANGLPALAYTGEGATEERIDIEERLLADEVKAVVATSALGMGYDKPDLRFVVHFQAPGSVVSYYQQVGRAGRGVDHADVVLLRGAEDRAIQDFFIEQAFPDRDRVHAVLEALEGAGSGGLTTRDLTAVVNLGLGRLEVMLKVLDVEGAIERTGSRWRFAADGTWRYDGERYRAVTALRRAEQAGMRAYGTDGRCLMRTLQEQLDDPDPRDCGRCSVCTSPRFASPPGADLVERAERHLRSRPLELVPRKMAPDDTGAMRRIPTDAQTAPGWALAQIGDGGWWPAIDRGLRDGRLDDEIVRGLAALVRDTGTRAAWITAVPSARLGDVCADVADRLAVELGIPHLDLLRRTGPRPPQREMANATRQAANVRGAFAVTGTPPPGTGLLLDDRRFSGWTLAMVGGQLRLAGADAVVPLVLATYA
jgi:ATP-dependent DNA helicase RecQ